MTSLASTAAAVLTLVVVAAGLVATRPSDSSAPVPAVVVPSAPDVGLGLAPHLAQRPVLPAAGPAAAVVPDGSDVVTYAWPTGTAAPVLRAFDPPLVRWAAGHRGVDLALAPGAAVLAAGSGTVAFAGDVAGRPVVSIQHADGIRTTYEPVAPVVAAGDRVLVGQVIGRLEVTTHCGDVSCLHWGARRGADAYLDPLSLLRSRLVRLYPSG